MSISTLLKKLSTATLYASVAAGVSLAANVLQAGSANAAIFNFDIQWKDSTTTKGWVEVDDNNPYDQDIQTGYYSYDGKRWNDVLDASFTHEGKSYGKLDINQLLIENYKIPADSYFRPEYGDVFNSVSIYFDGKYFSVNDTAAGGNTSASIPDYAYKYGENGGVSANLVSIVEGAKIVPEPAKAVPEPATLAGLALAGITLATTRRKQKKAVVNV